jgi:hypothetical protein
MVEPGENVKLAFENALHHYNRVLKELKNGEESHFSKAVVQDDIQENIDKITQLINNLHSDDWLSTVEHNRKLLCSCLRGYKSYLEVTKSTITTKLQDNLSLPDINLSRIDKEIVLAKTILKNSCEGYEL